MIVDKQDIETLEAFQEGLFTALMTGQFSDKSVRNEFDKLCAFITGTKRVDLMKQYLMWLQSESVINADDYTIIDNLLESLGIDLDA